MANAENLNAVREIVLKHARLSTEEELSADSDLYAAGLTSLTTVHVMLALEDHFDVEFRDDMLSRQTFETLLSICDAIDELHQ